MRVNRALLYTGVFLLAIGTALVAANVTASSATTLIEALRLSPLAVIAIGVGLVLRRTSLSLGGGLLATAVPGLVLGGAMATAAAYTADCDFQIRAWERLDHSTSFYWDDQRVDLDFDTVGIDPTGGCK